MQRSAHREASRFQECEGRTAYVTPTTYLRLLGSLQVLLADKSREYTERKQRYDEGLDCLARAETQVRETEASLQALLPRLSLATEATEKLLAEIAEQQEEAREAKEVVQREEAECVRQTSQAQELKEECESDLAEALPLLQGANRALKTLNKDSIVEIKSMKSPPKGVVDTMEAICIVMGVKPVKKRRGEGEAQVLDYWAPAQRHLLKDSKFLTRLVKFKKDKIPRSLIAKIQPYVERKEFQPDIIEKASKAAATLCRWIHAIVRYDAAIQVVAPKRIKVAEAEDALAKAEALLNAKREEVQAVEAKLADLQQRLDAANEKKQGLEDQVRTPSLATARFGCPLTPRDRENDRARPRFTTVSSAYRVPTASWAASAASPSGGRRRVARRRRACARCWAMCCSVPAASPTWVPSTGGRACSPCTAARAALSPRCPTPSSQRVPGAVHV